MNSKENNAFITALTNKKYIPGVKALSRCLKAVNSRYDLVILIPEERKEEFVNDTEFVEFVADSYNCRLRFAPLIKLPKSESIKIDTAHSYWTESFFKLQASGCTEYEKLVLLDSDMMIQSNIDGLFEHPHLSAVNADKYDDPDCKDLNSGLLVFEPSTEMNDRLIENIPPIIAEFDKMGRYCGDQDVFRRSYPEWKNDTSLRLDDKYNVFFVHIKDFCRQNGCRPEDASVIHFIGEIKPWMYSGAGLIVRVAKFVLKSRKVSVWLKYRRYCK